MTTSSDTTTPPSRWGRLLRTALQAPARFVNSITGNESFPLVWDSGASHCVTFDKNDFVSEIEDPGILRRVQGIYSGLEVKGIGLVQWSVHAENGQLRHFNLPTLLVPKCKMRLLSTSVLLRTYPGEVITQHSSFMRLSGLDGDPKRPSVLVPLDQKNGLLQSRGYRKEHIETAVASLSETISTVHSSNFNLTESEKELLKWHHRLGHLSFRRIQSLLRSGTFAHTDSARTLHRSVYRIRHPPKCAACLYGKQSARPIPRNRSTRVQDVGGALLDGHLFPGQQTSIDHFICSTRGRRFDSAGKSKPEKLYSGGIVFVDHCSDFVFVDHCISPNTEESVQSKNKYEAYCRDVGVVPQSYLSDNGRAFTSQEFSSELTRLSQSSHFAGVGAHHSNGKAENTIKRIMAIARTMMIHSAIHWPDAADASLWPMAVSYAVHIHNHVPQDSNGLSPIDVFTKTRNPTRRLLDLYVWGSPTYVLDKVIADGKKLPRWKPRSTRRMFMGLSPLHSSKAPLVLNLETGFISSQFHVVHDDTFATVVSTPSSIPDFTSAVWKELFGNATHYLSDDYDALELPADEDAAQFHRVRRRQDAVASNFDQLRPPRSLPDLPPPTSSPNDRPTSIVDFVFVEDQSPVRSQSDFLLVDPQREGDTNREGAQGPARVQDISGNQQFPESNIIPVSPSSSPIISTAPSPRMSEISLPEGEQTSVRVSNNSFDPSEINSSGFLSNIGPGSRSSRPTRNRRAPIRFSDEYDRLYHLGPEENRREISTGWVYVAPTTDSDVYTFDQIFNHPAFQKWIEAAKNEVSALEAKNTWVEVDASDAQSRILPGTWHFKIKRRPDGTIKKYKARYCVRGDLQEVNEETFAPVVAFSTVRIFLVLSLLLRWQTCTVDFSNAFVQADLDSPVWIHLPRGFKSNKQGVKRCLQLNKSLYGLRSAPKLWNHHIVAALLSIGFTQSAFDPCLFFRPNIIAILYVDDLGLAFPTENIVLDLLEELRTAGLELTREGTFSDF